MKEHKDCDENKEKGCRLTFCLFGGFRMLRIWFLLLLFWWTYRLNRSVVVIILPDEVMMMMMFPLRPRAPPQKIVLTNLTKYEEKKLWRWNEFFFFSFCVLRILLIITAYTRDSRNTRENLCSWEKREEKKRKTATDSFRKNNK